MTNYIKKIILFFFTLIFIIKASCLDNKNIKKIDHQEIYKTGILIINQTTSDKKSNKTLKIGNYFIEPTNMSLATGKEIINKIDFLLPLILFKTINKDFNLDKAIINLENDKEYKEIFENNKKLILNQILKSPFYKKSIKHKEFIKKVLLLALKTILEGEKEKGFLKNTINYFSNNFVDQFHQIISENKLSKYIEEIKNIPMKFEKKQLRKTEAYIIASIANFLENNQINFLESTFFDTLVHAITIPIPSMVFDNTDEMINLETHKAILDAYYYMLKLYEISNIEGIIKTKSKLLIVENNLIKNIKNILEFSGILFAITTITPIFTSEFLIPMHTMIFDAVGYNPYLSLRYRTTKSREDKKNQLKDTSGKDIIDYQDIPANSDKLEEYLSINFPIENINHYKQFIFKSMKKGSLSYEAEEEYIKTYNKTKEDIEKIDKDLIFSLETLGLHNKNQLDRKDKTIKNQAKELENNKKEFEKELELYKKTDEYIKNNYSSVFPKTKNIFTNIALNIGDNIGMGMNESADFNQPINK